MAKIEMPFHLPDAKEITFNVAGKKITVGASALKAGEEHSWAKPDHPTVVLKPLGDSSSENKEARDVLADRKNDEEVRRQAVEQLKDQLGSKGLKDTEVVMLGASTRFRKNRLEYV